MYAVFRLAYISIAGGDTGTDNKWFISPHLLLISLGKKKINVKVILTGTY